MILYWDSLVVMHSLGFMLILSQFIYIFRWSKSGSKSYRLMNLETTTDYLVRTFQRYYRVTFSILTSGTTFILTFWISFSINKLGIS